MSKTTMNETHFHFMHLLEMKERKNTLNKNRDN